LTSAEEVCLVGYDSHAGGGAAPFANHRKQNGGGEEGEGEASIAHGRYYPTADSAMSMGEGLGG